MKYITTKDVMEMFGVHRNTVTNWMKKGMPYYKVGDTLRFKESEVIEWFENQGKQQ